MADRYLLETGTDLLLQEDGSSAFLLETMGQAGAPAPLPSLGLILDTSTPGAITGSAGLTFSQSGTLQGLTQLTGTAGLTFGQSATAQGLTALTGSNGLTLGQTGTLSGNSALTGTAQITLGQSGSATGNTALTGTAQITFGQSGTLDPLSGDITGTAGITFGQSASLQGLTALTGTGSLTFAASGTLDQPGAITGTAGFTFGSSGTLDGLTALSGTASITFSASGALDQPQIEQQSFSGGYGFLYAYEREQMRRRRRKQELEDLEEESRALKDKVDREIAELLRIQEAKDEERDNLARLQRLVRQHSNEALALSDRAKVAYMRALTQANFSAMQALDRELQRMLEEEEITALMILLNED